MVKGLDVFRDWFNGFESCYTLIGGAACDLWMGDRDLGFPPQRSRQVLGEPSARGSTVRYAVRTPPSPAPSRPGSKLECRR